MEKSDLSKIFKDLEALGISENNAIELLGRRSQSKSLLIVSDLHIGSKFSVCSEDPERDSDNSYVPSYNQKKMNLAWFECKDMIQQKAKALVINGEPIDGDNFKSLGDSVWSTDLGDQLKDAEKMVKTLPYEKLYLTRGSGYHVTRGATNFEKLFGNKLGAEKYRSVMGTVTNSDYEANFKVNDKMINFTHHIGYSGWWQYRSTPIARELVKMHFAHKENGFHTDLLVRSHVHYYCEVRFPHTIGFTTPAWKFPDGFMYRRGIPELPTVGFMEVIIESNGKILIEPHLVQMKFPKPVINLDRE